VKRIVFNADDFGASERTNRAILRAHAEGTLTTTSLMVNEPGASQAVELANAHPKLGIGLHVVVSNGCAARSSAISPDGRFAEDPAMTGIRYFFSRSARAAIAAEVEEQFARFARLGLPWSHVDGHQHLHMHPVVWAAVTRQCEAHGIRRIRIPYEEWRPFTRERLPGRRMEWLFFRTLRRRCLRSIAGRGFMVMDRVYGHLESGRMSSEYLLNLLPQLGGATNEVYFHPGTPHAAPLPGEPDSDVELLALLDPRVNDLIHSLGLCLTTFADADESVAN
jgi:hopanoid biosynthesis associated protein HpnK